MKGKPGLKAHRRVGAEGTEWQAGEPAQPSSPEEGVLGKGTTNKVRGEAETRLVVAGRTFWNSDEAPEYRGVQGDLEEAVRG